MTLSTAQHSTAQHSTAQHSTAQHSTAQHSTAQHSTAQQSNLGMEVVDIKETKLLWRSGLSSRSLLKKQDLPFR